MFFNILKKDLKRKRTSNIIILIFVTLAAMFISSSVNNIICVLRGIDGFFDKAGLDCDYIVVAAVNVDDPLRDILEDSDAVTDYREELQLLCKSTDFSINGGKAFDFGGASFFLSIDNAKISYFDAHNDKINSVSEGEMYVHVNLLKKSGLEPGDVVTVDMQGEKLELRIASAMKDAVLGSSFLPDYRFIVNDKDYQKLCSSLDNVEKRSCGLYYIYSDDTISLKEDITEAKGVQFGASVKMLRTCYVMNMIVAALLLIISVGLILISFAVLRFAIGSTISEEIREIGVMKSVGIPDRAIRRLYIIKYLAISVIGALIGAAASIPFGKMLLDIISKEMVLDGNNTVPVALLCSVAVVCIIMLFCYNCTRPVSKLSPIDAVRSGQTGERFGRKSILSLGKSRLGTSGFLAANDCLSAPKQFGLITVILTLCLLPVMILANAANTLCSDKLIHMFCTTRSDVYIVDSNRTMDIIYGDEGGDLRNAREIERILAENGMPCKCHVELYYKYPIRFNDNNMVLMFMQCKETKTSDYVYTDGIPPANENEIALAPHAAELVGAEVGDTVMIEVDGEYRPFLVTALFSSFNQFGEIGRFHENLHTSLTNCNGTMAFQVDFDDDPDKKELAERIERIKDIFDNENVFDAAGYSKDCTGVADVIRAVELLFFIITIIVTILIVVLMERSFVSNEKSEIALMKAMGFRSSTIIAKHTLRFVIVSVIAAVIAVILCLPLTGVVLNPVFSIMGSTACIEYKFVAWEVFGLYPAAIILITAVSAFIASLSTVSITASQTADIE
ncbi:MAG: ABC transporter permease [Ruminococcus sp.]|nr:ABC transporter permease [Ruminococcus sp.]